MIASLRVPASSLFLAALAVAGTAFAQAESRREEARAVSGFSSIRLAVPARLELTQGDRESLTLEGPEEALSRIETVVEGETLVIRTREQATWRGRVRIAVDARRIEALSIHGSGEIRAAALSTPRLGVTIAGAGDVRIGSLEAERAEVAVSGSGDVRLAGRAAELSTRISGSGDVRADRLETRRVDVRINGSGDASVWARERLAVTVTGSGDVRYYGEPTVDKTIRGSGSVKRVGAAPT